MLAMLLTAEFPTILYNKNNFVYNSNYSITINDMLPHQFNTYFFIIISLTYKKKLYIINDQFTLLI